MTPRQEFIRKCLELARDENPRTHEGTTLVERAVQYAGSIKATKEEVEAMLWSLGPPDGVNEKTGIAYNE